MLAIRAGKTKSKKLWISIDSDESEDEEEDEEDEDPPDVEDDQKYESQDPNWKQFGDFKNVSNEDANTANIKLLRKAMVKLNRLDLFQALLDNANNFCAAFVTKGEQIFTTKEGHIAFNDMFWNNLHLNDTDSQVFNTAFRQCNLTVTPFIEKQAPDTPTPQKKKAKTSKSTDHSDLY